MQHAEMGSGKAGERENQDRAHLECGIDTGCQEGRRLVVLRLALARSGSDGRTRDAMEKRRRRKPKTEFEKETKYKKHVGKSGIRQERLHRHEATVAPARG